MTRTVPTGGAGGKANEYGRVQLDVGGQTLDHYLTYDAAGNLRQIDIVGDLTCDGVIDSMDDDAFKMLLAEPETYASEYPDCNAMLGDLDGSGVVDESDYELLVALARSEGPLPCPLDEDA